MEELRRFIRQEHGRTHEIAGGDVYRLAIRNGGVLLDRYPIINFSTGLTAIVDPTNNEVDVTALNGVASFGPAAVASITVVNGIVTSIS